VGRAGDDRPFHECGGIKVANFDRGYVMKLKPIGSVLLALFAVVLLLLIGLIFMQSKLKRGREEAAVETLTAIHAAEMKYKSSHGSFGGFSELIDAGLVHQSIGSTATSVYIYTLENSAVTFCANATRESLGKAYKDLNVDQTGVVRFVESDTVTKIPCGSGIPITGSK
jgi:hypothetical protein